MCFIKMYEKTRICNIKKHREYDFYSVYNIYYISYISTHVKVFFKKTNFEDHKV